jgi:hypothetical protein
MQWTNELSFNIAQTKHHIVKKRNVRVLIYQTDTIIFYEASVRVFPALPHAKLTQVRYTIILLVMM